MTSHVELVPALAHDHVTHANHGAAAPRKIVPPPPPQGIDLLPVTYDTAYTWDYGMQRSDLRGLYERSKGAMWNASTDLAWDTDVDPTSEVSPDATIPIFGTHLWDKLDRKTEVPRLRQMALSYMLSNFLHGEQGALLATAQIVSATPSADAKFYAATQVMDEARHVEAYDRYLREKVQMTFPISPYLRTLLDEILQEGRWDMKYLGMQILVEGLALAAFGFIQQMTQEPLLKKMVHLIMQDEARHVAFGVLSLKGIYKDMSASELGDRETFIVESSRLMKERFLMQEVWEAMGMPVEECLDVTRKSESQQMFQQLLFSKIVPNVKRLGLLTPRVRQGFEELGVIQFESWDASA
ncbi:MAG: ferritin-like domain-containing protein [Minicystis sp.]